MLAISLKKALNCKQELLELYEEEYEKAKFSDEYAQSKREWLASNWQGVAISSHVGTRSRPHNMTGASKDLLHSVGNAMCYAALLATRASCHPHVEKIFNARKNALDSGKGISMSFARATCLWRFSIANKRR